jgi:hypothetical protein
MQPPLSTPSNLENALLAFMQKIETYIQDSQSTFKNHEASIRNLETQMGQISRQLAERPQGTFPSDTVVNPKEQCKAITTRSGKILTSPQSTPSKNTTSKEEKESQAKDGTLVEDTIGRDNKEKEVPLFIKIGDAEKEGLPKKKS